MTEVLAHAPERSADCWQDRLLAKSVITPPPIEMSIAASNPQDEPSPDDDLNSSRHGEDTTVLHNTEPSSYPDVIRVVWPHRWEHDKGCDELLAIAREARRRESAGGPRIHWIVLGERFDRVPASMTLFLSEQHDRIEHAGPLPANAYRAMLDRADWVLSTARHEFFGMAVAEALLAGCLPWLPNRLSYPELIPAEYFELDPWKMASRSAGPQGNHADFLAGVRASIRRQLEPAVADAAVRRIEQEIDAAINL
jgi:glycosyltransferase involved in cell wall biosynthesis